MFLLNYFYLLFLKILYCIITKSNQNLVLHQFYKKIKGNANLYMKFNKKKTQTLYK